MDINYLKSKIYPNVEFEESLKIQPGEYISAEITNMLLDASSAALTSCFTKSDPNSPYTVEIKCAKCDKDIIRQLNKTKLFQYFRLHRNNNCNCYMLDDFLCEECVELIKEQMCSEKQDSKMKSISENTINYIDKFLKNKDSTFCNFNDVVSPSSVYDKPIAEYIKQMSYKDFLETPYWKAISAYAKYGSKCSICGSKNNLSTHHNSYKNHGYEHKKEVINNDLTVLCQDCHSKFHDKLPHSS